MKRTPRLRVTLAALVAASALTAGCAATRASSPFNRSGPRSIRIEVQNLNFNDATIHAIKDGQRQRLGIVTGKADATYSLEWQTTMPLQLEVSLLASDHCVTRAMSVDPGDVLLLQIQVDMHNDPECVPPSKY